MDLSFLPFEIYTSLQSINLDNLYEIRLRAGFPVLINIDNKRRFLNKLGSNNTNEYVYCKTEELNSIILNVCEHSLYAYNDRICDGYLTTKDGIRIGIAGECVFEKNRIVTIKNFSSLNIRIPHEIIDCSKKIFNYIVENNSVSNTLIISKPFCGKTTILKDLARLINLNLTCSTLIIDERGEFSNIKGQNIDILKFTNKEYALSVGLRSMSPEIIITDELYTVSDWQFAKRASNSGVKIIASVHAEKIQDLIFKDCFIKDVFDRYVLLESKSQPGVLDKVLNGDFVEL